MNAYDVANWVSTELTAEEKEALANARAAIRVWDAYRSQRYAAEAAAQQEFFADFGLTVPQGKEYHRMSRDQAAAFSLWNVEVLPEFLATWARENPSPPPVPELPEKFKVYCVD